MDRGIDQSGPYQHQSRGGYSDRGGRGAGRENDFRGGRGGRGSNDRGGRGGGRNRSMGHIETIKQLLTISVNNQIVDVTNPQDEGEGRPEGFPKPFDLWRFDNHSAG